MRIDCLLLTTACMLAATLGCQCGSLPSSNPPQNSAPTDSDRIEVLKQDILNKLGMQSESDVKQLGRNVSIEDRQNIMDVYKSRVEHLEEGSRDLEEESTLQSRQFFVFKDSQNDMMPSKFKSIQGGVYLYFDLDLPYSNRTDQELVVSDANLRLKIRQTKLEKLKKSEREITINIYEIVRRRANRKRFRRRLVYSKPVTISRSNLVAVDRELDLTQLVKKWIKKPRTNNGLIITAGSDNQHLNWITFSNFNSTTDLALDSSSTSINNSKADTSRHISTASLEVFTRIKTKRTRSKREIEKNDCSSDDSESRCCRRPMWVSFKDIGWDNWIVAPEGYQAYYCSGACPSQYKVANRHSNIQSMMHNLDPSLTPAPCCSATKLSTLSLMHYNADGHVVNSVLDDFIVDECKCT